MNKNIRKPVSEIDLAARYRLQDVLRNVLLAKIQNASRLLTVPKIAMVGKAIRCIRDRICMATLGARWELIVAFVKLGFEDAFQVELSFHTLQFVMFTLALVT